MDTCGRIQDGGADDGSYTNYLPPRINLELQLIVQKSPKISNWTTAKEKLYKQKNQFQHMTGRECDGDLRGLAGHSQAAAEVPEGYLSSWLDPPEKYGVHTLSWDPQPRAPEPEKYTDNIQLWKAAEFLSARDGWLEMHRAV